MLKLDNIYKKNDMKTRIHSAHIYSSILNNFWIKNWKKVAEEVRVYSLGQGIF